MDYKLAKQLRDAGYPQKPGGLWLFPADHNPRTLKGKRESAALRAYAPPLPELLDACVALLKGDAFRLQYRNAVWSSAAGPVRCRGPDPEAAMARLWVALTSPSPQSRSASVSTTSHRKARS